VRKTSPLLNSSPLNCRSGAAGIAGFEQGLAFDQRRQGEITPIEVHEVEGVVDDMDAAFAVAAALVRAKLGNPDSSPHSSPSK
jgi:hypothetical protein